MCLCDARAGKYKTSHLNSFSRTVGFDVNGNSLLSLLSTRKRRKTFLLSNCCMRVRVCLSVGYLVDPIYRDTFGVIIVIKKSERKTNK